METPFSWTLKADEIENVPKRQKTEEIHVQARDTDILKTAKYFIEKHGGIRSL